MTKKELQEELKNLQRALINNAEQFDLDYRGFVERFEVSGTIYVGTNGGWSIEYGVS